MRINPVIIFGAGSLGLLALDIFRANDIIVYAFLDDDPKTHGTELEEISILGATHDPAFLKLIGPTCDAFIATDDTALRRSLVKLLNSEREVQPINAIHPTAFVAPSAILGYGALIAAGAIVNSGATISNHAMLMARALADHTSTVGEYAQLGAGALLGAGATLGDGAYLGAGAQLVAGLSAGANSRIGAGSVCIEPVAAKATVFGNPAKKA
jgi:sugar O-acyltransferase (sialic acid O-acetyltransferase NeuD family)